MTTLSDIDQQIAALKRQKEQLIKAEKDAAMKKVMDAIAELNALGFTYTLVEEGAKPATTGKRRTGVRQEVLELISNKAGGMTRADVIEAMDGQDDKSLQQSISNALTNLKKAGAVSLDNKVYTVL